MSGFKKSLILVCVAGLGVAAYLSMKAYKRHEVREEIDNLEFGHSMCIVKGEERPRYCTDNFYSGLGSIERRRSFDISDMRRDFPDVFAKVDSHVELIDATDRMYSLRIDCMLLEGKYKAKPLSDSSIKELMSLDLLDEIENVERRYWHSNGEGNGYYDKEKKDADECAGVMRANLLEGQQSQARRTFPKYAAAVEAMCLCKTEECGNAAYQQLRASFLDDPMEAPNGATRALLSDKYKGCVKRLQSAGLPAYYWSIND